MTSFNRTLDPDFLDALEELAKDENGNWWRDVLQCPDLFIAVRGNYINVYYLGASIYCIEWKNRQVVPKTHIKYLVRQKQKYVELRDGEFQYFTKKQKQDKNKGKNKGKVCQTKYRGMKTLKQMCRAAKRFSGVEKTGLHPMLVGNDNVIDVEITLTGASSSNNKQFRIDAAIAVLEGGAPKIRFYEAKHFSNRKELRASGDKLPKVIDQLKNYEKTLANRQSELSEGYLETAAVLLRFNDMRRKAFGESAAREIAPAIQTIAESGSAPAIDTCPHLLVYGFDKAQRDDHAWKKVHLKKLNDELGGRVRAIGDTKQTTGFE